MAPFLHITVCFVLFVFFFFFFFGTQVYGGVDGWVFVEEAAYSLLIETLLDIVNAPEEEQQVISLSSFLIIFYLPKFVYWFSSLIYFNLYKSILLVFYIPNFICCLHKVVGEEINCKFLFSAIDTYVAQIRGQIYR